MYLSKQTLDAPKVHQSQYQIFQEYLGFSIHFLLWYYNFD